MDTEWVPDPTGGLHTGLSCIKCGPYLPADECLLYGSTGLCTDKQLHLLRHTGAHLSVESAVSLGVGNHGGSVCMCQPYMHTDALHNTGKENTDIEQVWERAHSQTPSDDEAIGL